MSPCLSGGGRAAYKLDLQIVTSPSTSWTSHSSSPSSTLSESSNSPIAISTRKPRTPRKRPNENYNEAAALLSTAYPKVFSTKHLTKPCKFTKPHCPFPYDSSELLLPFQVIDNPGFLLHQQIPILEKPNIRIEPKVVNHCEKPCQSPGQSDFRGNSLNLCDEYQEDFDAESILDEEIEEGIDSIMGNLNVKNESIDESNGSSDQINTCYGYPMGLGFGGNLDSLFGMRRGIKALRNVDEGDWWRFPTVDVLSITPKFNRVTVEKKKKKKVEKTVELKSLESAEENSIPQAPTENSIPNPSIEDSTQKPNSGLLLKLNYDEVVNSWSDRGSPFSDEIPGSESAGNDVHARLAQIDLFSESGGVREASVLRYKEKRRSRLFSKKIRYQVRKVNADRRPRMKGRFVRRSNSPESEQR